MTYESLLTLIWVVANGPVTEGTPPFEVNKIPELIPAVISVGAIPYICTVKNVMGVVAVSNKPFATVTNSCITKYNSPLSTIVAMARRAGVLIVSSPCRFTIVQVRPTMNAVTSRLVNKGQVKLAMFNCKNVSCEIAGLPSGPDTRIRCLRYI